MFLIFDERIDDNGEVVNALIATCDHKDETLPWLKEYPNAKVSETRLDYLEVNGVMSHNEDKVIHNED